MNGICELRRYTLPTSYSIENCKTGCLHDSRCFGVYHTGYGYCIEYMYKETYGCYLPRDATHFIHKGNHIVSNLIKFLFTVSNHAPVRKDA